MAEFQLILLTACVTSVVSTVVNSIKEILFKRKKRISEITQVKLAILTELQTVLNLYESFKLSPDEPKNGDDIKAVRISYKYNTVYSHNADKLGLMDKKVI